MTRAFAHLPVRRVRARVSEKVKGRIFYPCRVCRVLANEKVEYVLFDALRHGLVELLELALAHMLNANLHKVFDDLINVCTLKAHLGKLRRFDLHKGIRPGLQGAHSPRSNPNLTPNPKPNSSLSNLNERCIS